jgi:replication factor C subunit 3/5
LVCATIALLTSYLLTRVEKYRPSRLDDVTGQEAVVETVRQFVKTNRIPHMLFYGPPGTGKTSTITAIAREIYGDNYKKMVLELNASDDRGIDVVRNQIKTFASTRQIFAKGFKLIILDEADAMTNVAQNALRRIIEKYTTHTRFCILANYTHKLNPALLSRCTRFRFSPLSEGAIRLRMSYVIQQENVDIAAEAFESLLRLSQGDMRKALNILQACYAGVDEGSQISQDMVYDCVGSPHPSDIKTIMSTMMEDSWETALHSVNLIKQSKGLALADLLTAIANEFGDLNLKPQARVHLLKGLSEIEWRLSAGGSEKIQTSATIGVVKSTMEIEGSV